MNEKPALQLPHFGEYPEQQVLKVVLMLFELAPFPLYGPELPDHQEEQRFRVHALVSQAYLLLDKVHTAIAVIASRRAKADDLYRQIEKCAGEKSAVPSVVSYSQAIKQITKQEKSDRAELKLQHLLRVGGTPDDKILACMESWREDGIIPHDQVIALGAAFAELTQFEQEQKEVRKTKRKPKTTKAPLIPQVTSAAVDKLLSQDKTKKRLEELIRTARTGKRKGKPGKDPACQDCAPEDCGDTPTPQRCTVNFLPFDLGMQK